MTTSTKHEDVEMSGASSNNSEIPSNIKSRVPR